MRILYVVVSARVPPDTFHLLSLFPFQVPRHSNARKEVSTNFHIVVVD